VQYHSLAAGHDYGQYVRDAETADEHEIAEFVRTVMAEDSARAKQCHEFLAKMAGSQKAGPPSRDQRARC